MYRLYIPYYPYTKSIMANKQEQKKLSQRRKRNRGIVWEDAVTEILIDMWGEGIQIALQNTKSAKETWEIDGEIMVCLKLKCTLLLITNIYDLLVTIFSVFQFFYLSWIHGNIDVFLEWYLISSWALYLPFCTSSL